MFTQFVIYLPLYTHTSIFIYGDYHFNKPLLHYCSLSYGLHQETFATPQYLYDIAALLSSPCGQGCFWGFTSNKGMSRPYLGWGLWQKEAPNEAWVRWGCPGRPSSVTLSPTLAHSAQNSEESAICLWCSACVTYEPCHHTTALTTDPVLYEALPQSLSALSVHRALDVALRMCGTLLSAA